jgi:carboxymethylenebutenolidase
MTTIDPRSEELTFTRDGDRIHAFVASLPRHERMPAIIIVHDVRGLSEHYREIARRFAREGFLALAIDLYSREGAPRLPTLEAAFAWMQQLDDARILADIDAAARFLGSRIDVRASSIGITGFCMGGQYALMAACTVPNLAACVSFYGMLRYSEKSSHRPQDALDLAPQLACPYLGLFGEEDVLIPRQDVKQLEGILRKTGQPFQTKVYAGAGHAFFNDTRPDAYRPDAAKDAWQRCIQFFRTHLNPR